MDINEAYWAIDSEARTSASFNDKLRFVTPLTPNGLVKVGALSARMERRVSVKERNAAKRFNEENAQMLYDRALKKMWG